MKIISPFLLALVLTSCTGDKGIDEEKYLQEHEKWKESRIERLKSEKGWLNLAGLYWLSEGSNSFGADSSNQIIFPENAPAFCGTILKQGDSIQFIQPQPAEISVNGEIVPDALLIPDIAGNPTIMTFKNLAWYIIRRDSLYGIRLRDYEHPRIAKLDHIPAFEADLQWKKTAKFVPFKTMDSIWVPTATGTSEMYLVPGKLVFQHENETYELLPFRSGKGFFLIIGDRTSGIETYAAGRFLYTKKPGLFNRVVLDFNKAYNPPCAFSPYATCPLPPPENRLKLRITAGEKGVHLD
ncbi:MAG: DUF1684 domain-containing protein [Bacteroidales bacterium]|nr:DUF1684 domain-containing protein [Bacteroidales bacterium]